MRDRPRIVFVVDVPGWALDRFARRVIPYLTAGDATVAYLFPSLEALLQARAPGGPGPAYDRLPDASVYYCASWWFLWEIVNRRLVRPGRAYLADVVDDYSWTQAAGPFRIAQARAAVVLSQSLPFLAAHPTATFHPFPADPAHVDRPRPARGPGRRLRVGMIANGWNHAAADHKGVGIARRAVEDLPGVDLEVAGTDLLIPADRMVEWYDSIDVFLSLSLSEGFSNAIVDALALGVPVVATGVSPLEPFVGLEGYRRVGRSVEEVRAVLAQGVEAIPAAGRDRVRDWTADKVAAVVDRAIVGATGGSR